jgi:hypothetical protein
MAGDQGQPELKPQGGGVGAGNEGGSETAQAGAIAGQQQTPGVEPTAPIAGQPAAAIAGGQQAAAPGEAGAQVTPPPAAPQKKVDLTQFPEFQQYQAEQDRQRQQFEAQVRQAQQQAQEAQQRQTEMEQRLVEMQLAGATPQEQAEYWQGQAQKAQQALQQQQAAAQEASFVNDQARAILSDLNLTPDTPGLDWTGGPTMGGLQQLVKSAAKVVAQRAQTVQQQIQQLQAGTETAALDALREAGLVTVSTGQPQAPPSSNPIENVNDPDQLLRMAMGGGGKKR